MSQARLHPSEVLLTSVPVGCSSLAATTLGHIFLLVYKDDNTVRARVYRLL